MKTLILATVLALFCIPEHSIYASEGFRLEVNGGITLIGSAQGVLSNWNDGWTAGTGVAYYLSPAIEIGANLSYHRFPYQGDNLQLAFPAIVGLRWRVDGNATSMYESGVGVRFISLKSFVQPFVSLRGGAYFMSVGDVLVTTWMESVPQNTSSTLYRGTGESLTKGFGAIGFGINMPFDSNFQFRVEGRYTTTFDGAQSFIPLIGTFEFSL